ncbi:Ig-like domain-containing protein [Marseilla massiliensis]|uniref:Ig-like domain-containing protein n=2 Tax=Marseilla massiliensis TaxID=1841864 RepID=A0A938WTB3_9BACT|nr:Ig-like domain-containing protein [Marseilla massiliensis]
MGQPDGGWYDETPPAIVRTSPADQGVNIKAKKINIYFNEYIQVDNPTEKVVISPPQIEQAEIKPSGKKIEVELKDSLKPNTTYTIDFSDAISDNNENNPLGNYTFTFSTGDHIDTMQVAGYVLNAENLEPIKGILVGLYNNLSDTIFTKEPMLRVSRTDSRGHFVIKGVAPGDYRIYALQDADNNYYFNQKSEQLAFTHDIITPTFKPDIRQDTLWRDSLHIDSIARVPYTHFLPDDIVLRAFTEVQTDRYLIKSERNEPDHFTLFFSYGDSLLPQIRGLNFNEHDAFITELSEKRDTITYWLRDTMLVNQDTLRMELKYMATDTLGVLRLQTDTMDILSKQPYEKRMKQKQDKYEEWKKKQERAKKRDKPYETEMPAELLEPKYNVASEPDPDQNITIEMPAPLAKVDTSCVHLYSKYDTLWYRSPFVLRPKEGVNRTYELLGEWRPGIEYSLEIDTMAFTDIYGKTTAPFKQGFKVKTEDSYATLMFDITGMADTTVVVQLLNTSDAMVKETSTTNGRAEFYYIKPGTYYARMYVDSNKNGKWDTGDYAADRQAETTYYYPEKIECKEKWDLTLTWNPMSRSLDRQKPLEITKQKPEKEKTIKRRNQERASKLGIPYPGM